MTNKELKRENKKKGQIQFLVNQNIKQLSDSARRVIDLAESPYVSYKDVQSLIGCINWSAARAEEMYAELLDRIEINQFKATGSVDWDTISLAKSGLASVGHVTQSYLPLQKEPILYNTPITHIQRIA